MLTPQENERLCRVGAGTPMGTLMRRYWQPALLSEELPERDGAPVRVRLLGEDLIAFRDTDGRVGLVEAFCPHRRAPMFFGRNEDCGLRCVYHGWKFDRTGACVDMPSEPPDSLFKTKVRIGAYPAWEGGGIVWAYLGPADLQPPFPDYEFVRAPADHVNVTKMFQASNWLQGAEGAVDSVHSGFLHNTNIADRAILRRRRCDVEFDRTPYGLAGAAIHPLDDGRIFARTFHYVLPAHSLRSRVRDFRGVVEAIPTVTCQIYVPIDDEACWIYNYLLSADPDKALTREFVDARNTAYGRGPDDYAGGYRLKRNMDNDYLIDRDLQKRLTYSGIKGMNTEDVALQEGMGAICDRSREHLSVSDRVIIATRQLLIEALDAVERGDTPRGADPADYRSVRATDRILEQGGDWRTVVQPDLVARY